MSDATPTECERCGARADFGETCDPNCTSAAPVPLAPVTHDEAVALLGLLELGVEANGATALRLARALVASMGEAAYLRSRLLESDSLRRMAEEGERRYRSLFHEILYCLCHQQGGSAVVFDLPGRAWGVRAWSITETRLEHVRATVYRLTNPHEAGKARDR